jgi:hypothetical protein
MAPSHYQQQYYSPNQRAYLDYYTQQAGGGISRYRGGDQYGYGLGSILGAIIRKIIPIASGVIKPAVAIAKPHLKAAARDLTVAAVKKVSRAVKRRRTTKKVQTGGRRKRTTGKKRKTRRRRRRPVANIF